MRLHLKKLKLEGASQASIDEEDVDSKEELEWWKQEPADGGEGAQQ